eukprot:m.3892 g.3892  ORF g.3892 m.3892 type:complete len:243 (-) comp3759_c0_seq1:130-858(-)
MATVKYMSRLLPQLEQWAPKMGCLFDLDGTLVQTDHLHFKAWNILGAEIDLKLSEGEYKKSVSGRQNAPVLRELRPEFPETYVKELSLKKEGIFRDLLGNNAAPVNGADMFVEALHSCNIPYCIVTNAPRVNVDLMLSSSGLDKWFPKDRLVLAQHLRHSKPHPLPYLEGLKLLGIEARNGVVFEDSIAGITAGVRANINTVGVRTLLDETPMKDAGAFTTINDYSTENILALLESLSQKQS